MEHLSRSEALARGLIRYFTGKPCKRGHVAERQVSNGSCAMCDREVQRAWQRANPDKARTYTRAWETANPEKERRRKRARDAAQISATPAWADQAAILAVYAEAERLTLEAGVLHHVDHIVPLKHPLVCGLHIASNLRAIPASENMKKGNRHWPDMW